ncbi:hypothetical protein A9L51_19965 [Klebsiella pneumoniae]|nr:hypothetical protein A9L51_19965 [Klebsiella pneumoniae]OKB55421.1 hypothetical protein A9F06_26435 [Klebsiella pneumoniae]
MRIDRYLTALRIDPWIIIRTRLEKTAYDYKLFIFNGFFCILLRCVFFVLNGATSQTTERRIIIFKVFVIGRNFIRSHALVRIGRHSSYMFIARRTKNISFHRQ